MIPSTDGCMHAGEVSKYRKKCGRKLLKKLNKKKDCGMWRCGEKDYTEYIR